MEEKKGATKSRKIIIVADVGDVVRGPCCAGPVIATR